MIVVSSLVSVILAVFYFKEIGTDHVKEGITIGVVWLVINLGIDLVFVSMGFFTMTVIQYLTDIGLRYTQHRHKLLFLIGLLSNRAYKILFLTV